MDYANPAGLVAEALRVANKKAALPVRDMLLRGALAGVFLGYATSMAFRLCDAGPAGLELATGNFALLPPACAARQMTPGALLRN
jgi:formate/nitrite transporter FocA (FNT family)